MRILRILLATLALFVLTIPFLDVTGWVGPHLTWGARLQFLPALLSLPTFAWSALTVVAAIVLFTLLFGRVYCSVICPLGILQDLIARLVRLFPHRAYAFAPARTKTRLAFLALAAAGIALGLDCAVLAPYGIYGRAVAAFLTPLAALGNNALAPWCQAHGHYVVRAVEIAVPATAALVGAGAVLALVAACAAARGRLWCNAVCPVGTLLGYLSRYARFRPRIVSASCVDCGACVRACKCQCIDLKSKTVDATRCVACFNCSAACRKGALTWK